MYNKLFAKILDSSIWLEPTPTRIVWLTFIAVMDEDGFVQFASVANVAHRAVVTMAEAEDAIRCLESADANSSDPDHEGRRVERVPGGWLVLNAAKHRELVTRATIKNSNRERARRYRERRKGVAPTLVDSNAAVTPHHVASQNVTQSVSVSEVQVHVPLKPPKGGDLPDGFAVFWTAYPRKDAKVAAIRAWRNLAPDMELRAALQAAVVVHAQNPNWLRDEGKYIPLASTWLNGRRWEDELKTIALVDKNGYVHPDGWQQTCDWCKALFDPGKYRDGSYLRVHSCPACQRKAMEA